MEKTTLADFGGQLWDQWLEVETLTTQTAKSLDTLQEYFRRRAEIELEYAQKLSKLAKPHKDEITRLATDRQTLVNETENAAKIHTSVAEKLDSELKKTIKAAFTDLDSKQKSKFNELKAVAGELQKAIAGLDKMKERYEADKKVLEQAHSNFGKLKILSKAPGDVELAKLDLDKKKSIAKTSMAAYQQALLETNAKQNQTFSQTIPTLLNEINNQDQQIRISTFHSSLRKYFNFMSTQLPLIQSGLDAMNAVSSSIDGDHDAQVTVKCMRTGEPIPPDYLFDEKPVYEITGKRMGRSPSAIRKEIDEGGDGAILSMPPKAGKKLAQDKLKQYEKDSAELERKIEDLQNLCNVYDIFGEKIPDTFSKLSSSMPS
ncbi:Formin-binding protein 1 [Podochytrium sp. JEL0797]|nr:Formin-binding protein 1 [Podochytrium sp. JEL0797]